MSALPLSGPVGSAAAVPRQAPSGAASSAIATRRPTLAAGPPIAVPRRAQANPATGTASAGAANGGWSAHRIPAASPATAADGANAPSRAIGAPRSAGGRQVADLFELPAVQDAALLSLVERGERALLAGGDDLLDGDRPDARKRLELLGSCRVEIHQPAVGYGRTIVAVGRGLLSAGCRRLSSEHRDEHLLPVSQRLRQVEFLSGRDQVGGRGVAAGGRHRVRHA